MSALQAAQRTPPPPISLISSLFSFLKLRLRASGSSPAPFTTSADMVRASRERQRAGRLGGCGQVPSIRQGAGRCASATPGGAAPDREGAAAPCRAGARTRRTPADSGRAGQRTPAPRPGRRDPPPASRDRPTRLYYPASAQSGALPRFLTDQTNKLACRCASSPDKLLKPSDL
jgi:hypothetical protein